MLEFVEFDRQRLYAFRQNPRVTDSIKTAVAEGIHLLKFQPVDYFNYAFGSIPSEKALSFIQSFFQDRPSGSHKLIIHAEDLPSQALLENRSDYRIKNTYRYFQARSMDIQPVEPPELQLIPVDQSNIHHYANLYLEVFNAENRHPDSVEENLFLLLSIPKFKAFLVQVNDEWIGICSFWIHHNTLLYTAGGVREPFRGLKYHLGTMAARTLWAKQMGEFNNISSWAISESASSFNLNAFGLTNTDNYLAYEFIGTP